MAGNAVEFLTPVGRLVWGNLYEPKYKDDQGKPYLDKEGNPQPRYSFGVAIRKGGESHWNQTPLGRILWDTAVAAWPQGQTQMPSFSFKVTDGDSTALNNNMKRPCDKEGFPGHWVFAFSGTFAPAIFNANGTAELTQKGAVKAGYYVQVKGSVAGNGSDKKPGIYLNYNMIALSAYGEEIVQKVDASQVGFGQSPLPPGASAVPIGGMPQPSTGTVATTVTQAPPVATVAAPLATPTPHTTILAPAAPAAAPAPAPVPTGPQMTAAATTTYAEYIKAGWTDALLRQHGLMV